MTDNTTEPIRKSLLPCTPPPEWEFHTVFGARTDTDGCALFPGDTGPVVVRRLVTYGGWEPVRPDRWADEPPTDAAPAVVPSVDRAAVPAPAEPFPIWTVWREDQPAYGYFATEDIAKQASVDCWEEDEPACPDYSWRPSGPSGGWELLVGDERAEVYIRRHLVWGGLPQPPRAAVLTEAADEETDADVVANRAAQVITTMGADIRALTSQRDRYRSAWTSARGRAQAYGEGILRVVEDREAYQQWLKQAETQNAVLLRRLAGEAAPDNTETCVHCGKPVQRITGTLAAWWVHDPGGNTMCAPRQGAGSPCATPTQPGTEESGR